MIDELLVAIIGGAWIAARVARWRGARRRRRPGLPN